MAIKKRILTPKLYTNYISYKKYLRIEFDHSCAYCQIRETELGGNKSFHIDHFQPQKLFPEKHNDYLNLLYSCRDCNSYKGNYWPNSIQKFFGQFILNPCLNDLEKHYDFSGDIWVPKSKTATWNLDKLRLNSQARQKIRSERRITLEIVLELENLKIDTEKTLKKRLEKKLTSNTDLHQRLIKINEMIDIQKKKLDAPLD